MKKNYLLTTDDGSSTLFLEEYEQAMHSMSGAYEESLLKHIIPSKILLNKDAGLKVLDIGFGLGYNVLALMNEFINSQKSVKLDIISLEKDKYFSEFMMNLKFNDSRDIIYGFIREVYISGEGNYHGINLKILFGDARDTLQQLTGIKFHAVFQDPFSPSKNPELWTVDYFRLIKDLLENSGIITTYSSADQIRRAMIEAGLRIGRGPSVGKKREGTLASASDMITEINANEITELLKNIKSTSYKDPCLNFTRETILENRIIEMKKIRNDLK
jgi:chorismate dehydratase